MSYQFPTLDSGDQSIGARYTFLEDGTHRLVIHRIAVRGRSKAMYIIESEVLESNNTECPPGSRRSSFIDLTNADMRGKNIAGFLAAVYGVEPTTLAKGSTTTPWDGRTWTEYAAYSAGEQNPLAGRKVDAFVQTIQTQEGSDFSAHNWSPAGTLTMQPPISIPSASKTQRAPAGPQGAAPGFSPPGFAPPGAAPGGFMAPPPQPGAAPQGFGAPVPPPGGAPGFAPPGGAPMGAPPLGGFVPPPAAAPQEQWLPHPQSPAHEYNPVTQQVRARQVAPAVPPAAPMPPQEQWLPHPQSPAHEYNPATQAVRPRQTAPLATPPAAPMPPQGAPAMAPGAPWGPR